MHEGAISSELKAKFADPAVRQAISYWVMTCVSAMGATVSERKIKKMLLNKLNGRVSPLGVNYIYELAKIEFEQHKGRALPIIISSSNDGTSQQN